MYVCMIDFDLYRSMLARESFFVLGGADSVAGTIFPTAREDEIFKLLKFYKLYRTIGVGAVAEVQPHSSVLIALSKLGLRLKAKGSKLICL